MTLYEVFKNNALEDESRVCYTYFGKCFYYSKELARIDALAAFLEKNSKGNIAICMPNTPDMMVAFYAANKLGRTAVMLNPKMPYKEMIKAIRISDAQFMIVSNVALNTVNKVLSEIHIDIIISNMLKDMPLFFTFSIAKRIGLSRKNGRTFDNIIREYMGSDSFTNQDDDEDAVMIYSGGTGGKLKAVVHSSRGIIGSIKDCEKLIIPYEKNSSMLAVLPNFHIFGLIVGLLLPSVINGNATLLPFFHMPTIAKLLVKDSPRYICVVPTILERLKNSGLMEKYAAGKNNLSNFSWGFCGGDFIAEDVLEYFNDFYKNHGGDGYISVGYGMSECCPISVGERGRYEKECIGKIQSMTKVSILDDSGNELKDMEVGEICISSPYLMKRSIDEFGVNDRLDLYRTGDFGYKNGDRLYYKTRIRRIIKNSGHSIFAEQIENILLEHEDVLEAYVVPMKHSVRGYVPFAYIVKREGADENNLVSELSKLVKENMVSYGIPYRYRFVRSEDIKRTILGKVVYGDLENDAK